MSDWEAGLPPIMRERLAKAGELSQEERTQMKDRDQLSQVLSAFYKGDLDSDGLWRKVKVFKEQGKTSALREAQLQLIDSLTLGASGPELQKRRAAIVAIETLKAQPSTSMIEQTLGSIDALQTKHKKELQQGYDYIKTEVERNPQLRMQQVKQGEATVLVQLTVDEATKLRPEWKNFVAEHEQRFSQEFARIIERLKKQVK